MPQKQTQSKSDSSDLVLRPAFSPEDEEDQCICLAMSLAKKQLIEGTASSQVICHYLKAASIRERKELERLEAENKLLQAKTDALESSKRSEQLLNKAIEAFGIYSGENQDEK